MNALTTSRATTIPHTAWRTVMLLALHQYGVTDRHEIGDTDGHALRIAVLRMGLRFPATPDSLTKAVRSMKNDGIIDSETEKGRCYSVWLLGQLSPETVAALQIDKPWAIAAIRGETVRRPGRPPVVEFLVDAGV